MQMTSTSPLVVLHSQKAFLEERRDIASIGFVIDNSSPKYTRYYMRGCHRYTRRLITLDGKIPWLKILDHGIMQYFRRAALQKSAAVILLHQKFWSLPFSWP
jgi:hypothetical protein